MEKQNNNRATGTHNQDDKSNNGQAKVGNHNNAGNDNKAGNDNNNAGKPVGDNTIKNPDNWTTGDEPMTGAQSSYLHTLASEAGESVEDDLTKAAASKKIEELQQKTGRGLKGQGEYE